MIGVVVGTGGGGGDWWCWWSRRRGENLNPSWSSGSCESRVGTKKTRKLVEMGKSDARSRTGRATGKRDGYAEPRSCR